MENKCPVCGSDIITQQVLRKDVKTIIIEEFCTQCEWVKEAPKND